MSKTFLLCNCDKFLTLKYVSNASIELFIGSFIKTLFLNSISHLFDGKKYNFFISLKLIKDFNISCLIKKKSSTDGFPITIGKLGSVDFDFISFLLAPIIKFSSSEIMFAKKDVFFIDIFKSDG